MSATDRAEAEKVAAEIVDCTLPGGPCEACRNNATIITDALVTFAHRAEVLARSDTWRQASEMVNEPMAGDFRARAAGVLMDGLEGLDKEPCQHERLNAEGICIRCGADKRGLG